MFRIGQISKKLEKFFENITGKFIWNQFYYMKMFVVLIAISWGRKNVSALYKWVDDRSFHRSRYNNFLNTGNWNPALALSSLALNLVNYLKPQKGEDIYLIIDDSKKQKRGKHIDSVFKIFDPVTKKHILGHNFVAALLVFRGFVIPFAISLYTKKEHCKNLEIKFKKKTWLAAEIITQLSLPTELNVTVLFDTYYLCPPVVKACKNKAFHFVSYLKANRNLFKNGRKLKTGSYSVNLFRRIPKKTLKIKEGQKTTTYRFIDAGVMKVSNLGELRVIVSRKNKFRNRLVLVTDNMDLSAANIIKKYAIRWTIEVFFKETKQLLGLGQYQNRSYRAAVTHLHLVCFSYALLTHLQITQCEKGKRKKDKVVNDSKMSTASMQSELRKIAFDDAVENIKKKAAKKKKNKADFVIKEFEKLFVS